MTIGVANIRASQSMGKDAAKESSDIKKQFREEVLKAAEEYKHEHKTEISTEESLETEFTTSHEIKNPNDELPVTFLFYELQRSFQVSEKIHKLTPVVLIANSVPTPHEINESWLLTHDWILKRVILDDSFLPALEYLSQSFVGAELSLEIQRINMEKQMKIVKDIGQQVNAKNQALLVAQSALSGAIEKYKEAQDHAGAKRDAVSTFFDPINIVDTIAGGEKPDYDSYRLSISSAQEALDRAQRQADDLRSQLETEMSALQIASDKYSEAMKDHFNRQTQTDKLRIHIKDNILYYMQAIWNHEPPDQRFFRLYDQEVPIIEANRSGRTDATVRERFESLEPVLSGIGKAKSKVTVEIPFPPFDIKYKKLVDIADLDNLLGYKGNYMIFPLKENNYLTHYMMQDYIDIDQIVSLRDPDEYANHSTDELQEFMKCEYRKNPRRFRQNEDGYKDLLIRRLSSPLREKDIVVVPTTSLYIEALPGKHPLLEDFKLIHRALDNKKVQAEVRHAELENIRLASRALKGKDEDPDIEKKIIIEGDGKDVVIHPDDS